jgi:hypothetical protein
MKRAEVCRRGVADVVGFEPAVVFFDRELGLQIGARDCVVV